MSYFNYAIKCVIRNIIYKLMKPRNFIIIVVSLIIIFLLSQYTTVFGWTGDDTYTDVNNTITITYDSLINDFIIRLNNLSKNNVNYNNLLSNLNNGDLSFYLYYGDINGRTMTANNSFVTDKLHIIFYSKSDPSPSMSLDETYFGMHTTMYNISSSNIQNYYYFLNGILYTGDKPSSVTLPGVLISYVSGSWSNYFNNDSQQQTNDIVGAINEQTNSINEQTNTIQEQTTVIQETQDFITNDTVTDSNMTVDNSYTVDNAGVDNFFSTFLNVIYNTFNSIGYEDVTIQIPLPHNIEPITLHSNIISKYIVNTPIYIIIQTFWTFVFGSYLVMFVRRIIQWLSSGKVVEEGIFSFAEWMDIHNEIIKSYML